jgi:hypothetical protein
MIGSEARFILDRLYSRASRAQKRHAFAVFVGEQPVKSDERRVKSGEQPVKKQ